MTFTPEQIAALKAPLDRKHVKQRSQAGRQLSYIESWQAISEANRIFGFDGWNRETVDMIQLGEPRLVDGKNRVAYMAKVRVNVFTDDRTITREGTGYGSGIDKDLGQAHESAVKEAESDAMKRALMTFGNPFGLALYDKEQANVADLPAQTPDGLPQVKNAPGIAKARKWVSEYLDDLRQVENPEAYNERMYGARNYWTKICADYPGLWNGPDGSGLRGEAMKIAMIVGARQDFDTFVREVELMAKETLEAAE